MIDVLNVYLCPIHGEILSDQVHDIEIIDMDNDEVWTERACTQCGASVRCKMVDGIPALAKVDHDRWLWANGYYDDLAEASR